MQSDSGVKLPEMRVDGGITANELCMQMQSDIMQIDVVRPKVIETTALGAAYAAGLGDWLLPRQNSIKSQLARGSSLESQSRFSSLLPADLLIGNEQSSAPLIGLQIASISIKSACAGCRIGAVSNFD